MSKSSRRSKSAARPASPAASRSAPPARGETRSLGDVKRHELLIVTMLLIAGCGMRWALPGRMAAEHFDEGVYASNIWFGPESGYQYPGRQLYAPPLLPNLVEWSIIVEQMASPQRAPPSSLAVMAPSLLAGCLTLVAVWWTGREWFGPAAGIASLALATLSDFHALYSRTALTDALLVFFLVSALWALRRGLAMGSYKLAVVAGGLTALAWWTKYNGWLPLAIGLVGLMLEFVTNAASRSRAAKLLSVWTVTAVVAVLVWSPYLAQLQSAGGYSPIAANHRQYVVGLAGWWQTLKQQHANLTHFDGWASSLSLAIAVLAAGWCLPRATSSRAFDRWPPWIAIGCALTATAVWSGNCVALALLAAAFFVFTLRFAVGGVDACAAPLAVSITFAWVVGLFCLIPLYHPYPRLTLPWLCGAWIGAGAGIEVLLRRSALRLSNASPAVTRWCVAAAVVGLLAMLTGMPGIRDRGLLAWQSRTGFESVAQAILQHSQSQALRLRGNADEAILVVYGEPGLFYQLNAFGGQAVIVSASLNAAAFEDAPWPAFLIVGPHAQRTPSYQEEFAAQSDRLRLVQRLEYTPSDLVLLNHHDARSLPADRTEHVLVYEFAR